MEHVLPLYNHDLNHGVNELNELKVSKTAFKPDRNSKKIKSFKTVNDDFFDEEDAELIDMDPENPFSKVFDDTNKKNQKYKEKFPKDDSFTDTNFDSTDTEPTDTDLATSTDSELSIYKTTTDSSDRTESINPNTEAHGHSSPTYDPSEDDSAETTDSEYFDSDATTESSEQSYTSLSENVDDSPDPSTAEEEKGPEFPPAEGGPPETFQWSEDEQMEIPVKDTGAKTIDPFEEDKKRAREKLGPDFEASANPSWRERDRNIKKSGVSSIVAGFVKHLAPTNSVNFESDLSERMSDRIIQRVPKYKDMYRLSNSYLK